MLGLRCCRGFSPVTESRGSSLGAAGRLLIATASLVSEHRLEGTWVAVAVAPRLYSTGSIVAAHGPSCSEAHGVFPDHGCL